MAIAKEKEELILGIHGNFFNRNSIVHESSAAIVSGGKLLAAVSEERLSRKKGDGRFPEKAIRDVLTISGVSMNDVDRIVLSNLHPADTCYHYFKSLLTTYSDTSVLLNKKITDYFWYWIYNSLKTPRKNKLSFGGKKYNPLVEYTDHHRGHAASAYYASPFDDALVVTLDGGGDGNDGSVYMGRGAEMKLLYAVPHNQSPGTMYSALTYDLGFMRHRHEGKITGLAAFGNPDIQRIGLEHLIRFDPSKHRFISKQIASHQKNLNTLSAYFTPLLKTFPREDLAAVVQKIFEQVTVDFIRDAANTASGKGFKSKNICLAGGCFANVKLNQRILEMGIFENIFVFPAMGDEGLSSGAALSAYYGDGKKEKRAAMQHAYLGKSFSETEIENTLKRFALNYTRSSEVEKETGRLLAQNKIVARFSGAMEYGPRALGNRSILGAPFDHRINDWLNKKLRRTEFMPFAPSMLEEYADDYLVGYRSDHHAAEYMTLTYDIKPGMKEKIPAVVHIDNTARPQIVKKNINPGFHQIISEFNRLSGCPVVLNTSFNIHEEPIVYSPEDAVRGFLDSELDYLSIGPFLVDFNNK